MLIALQFSCSSFSSPFVIIYHAHQTWQLCWGCQWRLVTLLLLSCIISTVCITHTNVTYIARCLMLHGGPTVSLQIFPDAACRRELNQLQVHCCYGACDWKGLLKDFEVNFLLQLEGLFISWSSPRDYTTFYSNNLPLA